MKQVVLVRHPVGNPSAEDFRVEEVAIPSPLDGQVLLKTLWLSLDPLIRFALDEVRLTGAAHVRLGEVIYGGTVSEVVESRHPDFAVGDILEGRSGWREYAALDPLTADRVRPFRKIDAALAPIQTALGMLGMPGQTAHACVIGVGRVKAGETVVISAAGGAVGSLAGQIAKRLDARVIGIAGGAAKCARVKELGFDDCVDYKAPEFRERLAKACEGGVDCYIDNVGGEVTQAVLPHLKYGARMPVCGFIAYYGTGLEGPGPDRLPGFMRTIMSKGLEVRGFGGSMIGGQAALDDLAKLLADGKINPPETVVEGLAAAPAAFVGIFGDNSHIGKLLVKI